jgi:hypothetical protein
VPYSLRLSIITLTAFVKIITLLLTKKQVESCCRGRTSSPEFDIIGGLCYGEDKDKIQKEYRPGCMSSNPLPAAHRPFPFPSSWTLPFLSNIK